MTKRFAGNTPKRIHFSINNAHNFMLGGQLGEKRQCGA
jgi:hypothetical protein